MKIGEKVKLAKVLGTTRPPADVLPHENYWRMIGMNGVIEDIGQAESRNGRMLIRFEDDISALGLECHNPIPNTLWILPSDLDMEANN